MPNDFCVTNHQTAVRFSPYVYSQDRVRIVYAWVICRGRGRGGGGGGHNDLSVLSCNLLENTLIGGV